MKKYQIVCKNCNNVLEKGLIENVKMKVSQGIDAKCPSCGKDKMAMEVIEEDESEMTQEFDLFITNKRTGITKHSGFIMADFNELATKDFKELFVTKSAEALLTLLDNKNNLEELIKKQRS